MTLNYDGYEYVVAPTNDDYIDFLLDAEKRAKLYGYATKPSMDSGYAQAQAYTLYHGAYVALDLILKDFAFIGKGLQNDPVFVGFMKERYEADFKRDLAESGR